MDWITEISEAMINGKAKKLRTIIIQAIESGIEPRSILNQALLPSMLEVSTKYKEEQFYIPEVLMASRAMAVGTQQLSEYMVGNEIKAIGTVIVGTVKGDLHNIGKNLVVMMLHNAGFKVIDIGVDVSADLFMQKAEEHQADIICMSAMLTTTMPQMQKVIQRLKSKGVRHKYIIMVGGAPVTETFAKRIGADIYTSNAVVAAEIARNKVLEMDEIK